MANENDNEEPGEAEARRIPLLVWTLAASLMLHASVLVPGFLDAFSSGEADFDVEWLQNFDNLEQIGHGGGRWAKMEEIRRPERAEEKEQKKEEEEEPKEEEKKREDEKEREEKPKKKPEEKKSKPKPKPKKKKKKEKPESRPELPDEKRELAKRAPREDEPDEETYENPEDVFSKGEDLPGVDRSGPSELPSMEGYGPGNAIFTALVRLDRIRGSRFEKHTRDILERVPDYRIALKDTGIDPVADLDSMFMASAAPRYIQHTFLAVRHQMSDSVLRQKLDRRFDDQIPWKEHAGHPTRALVPASSGYHDPRQIMIARPGLALITRPEWLDQLTSEVPQDSKLLGDAADKLPGRPKLIDGLYHIERAAEETDTLVVLSAQGARVILPGIGRMRFQAAKLSVTHVEAPRLTIDISFPTPRHSKRFADGCPRLKKRILDQVPFLARNIATTLLGPLECEASGYFATVKGQYSQEDVERLMNIAMPFIPRPPSLAQLPPSPPPPPSRTRKPAERDRNRDAGETGIDAGNGDSDAGSPDAAR